MNLFKDPRTNWRYIGIVVILAVIAGLGYWGYWSWWIKKQETKLAEIPVL